MSYKKLISQLTAVFGFVAALPAAINVDFADVNRSVPPAQNYTGPGGGVFYNGSDSAGGFTSSGVQFTNTFTDSGGGFTGWDGWSYSTTTDTTTPGFGNQYSAFTGGGNGDAAYGVYFGSGVNTPTISLGAAASAPQSMFVTNTTYATLSMLNGDSFSKQFGGITGDDEDWFLLSITGFDFSSQATGTVEFYLADYRFADNSQDYIVDEWTEVDLTGLGANVSGIQFELTSSDVGQFGMNTPAYFAMDNFSAVPESSTYALLTGVLALFVLAKRRR